MNRSLTRDQLKVARAIRVSIEKEYPEFHYTAVRDKLKSRFQDETRHYSTLTDEDIRLIELSSKGYADYWRKAEKSSVDGQWRRQYACFALMGLLMRAKQNYSYAESSDEPCLFAEESFRYADAMIAEELAASSDTPKEASE